MGSRCRAIVLTFDSRPALARCLDALRSDRDRRRRMGDAAQALVFSEYDVGATARQIAAAVSAVR